jgi:5'(3')-deoxyribonucleotidase
VSSTRAGKTDFRHDQVTDFNICDALGVPGMWPVLRDACGSKGFVEGLDTMPGSEDGIAVLRAMAEVFVVTSPMSVPNWAFERGNWLGKKFDFPKDRIVQTEAKFVIEGDILVDDKIENVLDWAKAHPEGLGIIFHATYNKNYIPEVTNISRAFGWKDVITLCQSHFDR